ncbi:MAG: TatD family hydrolase [Candidatus Uhrbacteria bacterium]
MPLKPPSLVDTHCHIHFNAYKPDMDEVIRRSLAAGIFMITVGTQTTTSQKAVEVAEKYDGLWAAVGLHPCHTQEQELDADEIGSEENIHTRREEFDLEFYRRLFKSPKAVAIGEMGLDYHHFEAGDDIEELKNRQKEAFLRAIQLANEVEKPLIIHCWDAYDDLLEILKNNPVKKTGVVHSFVGSHKTAKKFLELGYKIGLNGIITYSESYDRLIRELSLEDILIETDAPYLAPPPHRGERNEPSYVIEVAKKIAALKEKSLEEVAEATTNNAKKVFNLNF